MRCFGITKPLKRCKNNAKFLYCSKHWLQPIVIISGLIILIFGSYRDFYLELLNPHLSPSDSAYTASPIIGFSRADSSYKILILPFDRLQKDPDKELKLEKIILNEFNTYKADGINTKFDSTFEITDSKFMPDSIGLDRNADLVLTGIYYEVSSLTKLICAQIFRNAIDRDGTLMLETYISIEPNDKIVTDYVTTHIEFKNMFFTDEDIISGKLNYQILNYVYFSLGMRSLHSQKWKDCITFLNKISRSNNDTFILECKGYCYYYLGDFEGYIVNQKRILALDPTKKTVLSDIGKAFEKLNQVDSAQYYFKKSMKK